MITLEHNPDANNMAGICKALIIERESIDSILPYKDEVKIILKNNPETYSIRTREIDVSSTMVRAGLYDHSVQIRLHVKNVNYAMTFDAMARKRFVVVLTYNNETQYAIGTKDEPLRFTFDDTSDGKPDGTTAYTITLTGKTFTPQTKVNQII